MEIALDVKHFLRVVTIAGFTLFAEFVGESAIFLFLLEKLEFLGFLSMCLSLMCSRQDVKRPVGFVYDSV